MKCKVIESLTDNHEKKINEWLSEENILPEDIFKILQVMHNYNITTTIFYKI